MNELFSQQTCIGPFLCTSNWRHPALGTKKMNKTHIISVYGVEILVTQMTNEQL